MLPLSLKVVWLVFAILGVPATWFVFIPFASTIGTYWALVLYCITVTVLEVTFSLGMIWRMTPPNMPHSFCVVQTVIIALCFYVLTGVCGCITWASYLTVFKPYQSTQASASALLWRRPYFLFVMVFPSLAFTAHLVVVLKTDSVHPVNDMHCDNTSPLWPRLLGYAGAPIVLFTPCFILSIVTAVRIIGMHARIRELQSQEGARSHSIRVDSSGSRIAATRPLATTAVNGVSDKPPPPTLDGQKGMTIDIQLHGSSTRSFSQVSLPSTPSTVGINSSATHFPIEPPSLSPLAIPSAYLSQLSPPSSTRSPSFHEVDRVRTPSPIVFAHAPKPYHHAQFDAGEFCNNLRASSDYASERDSSLVTVSEEPHTSPVSPSRAPVSLELGERMPWFHLPTRSPPNELRPSLELSPEYVRARLEEDRVILARCPEDIPVSPCPSHCHPLSGLSTGKSPDTLPSITYTNRAPGVLPGLNEADNGSIVKGVGDFVDGRKVVSAETLEPRLEPVRRFYRSAPRPSIGRPPGLHPAIWRMVVFQLVFFFILILASLSTFIDLIRDRPAPAAFGTQDIAILLVAWCPAIVFGYLPGDRNSFPFVPRHGCA